MNWSTLFRDMWIVKRRVSLLLLFLLILAAGCSEKVGDEKNESDAGNEMVDTTALTKLPAGRTELPTWNTPAPNLFITLPQGLAVRTDSGLAADRIVIYRKGDPALADSTLPPLGVLQVVVSRVTRDTTIPATKKTGTLKRLIGSYPAVWHQYVDTTVQPSGYLMNVVEISDYFSSLGPDNEAAGLHLWIYVAGTDLATVRSLLLAAESISITP